MVRVGAGVRGDEDLVMMKEGLSMLCLLEHEKHSTEEHSKAQGRAAQRRKARSTMAGSMRYTTTKRPPDGLTCHGAACAYLPHPLLVGRMLSLREGPLHPPQHTRMRIHTHHLSTSIELAGMPLDGRNALVLQRPALLPGVAQPKGLPRVLGHPIEPQLVAVFVGLLEVSLLKVRQQGFKQQGLDDEQGW